MTARAFGCRTSLVTLALVGLAGGCVGANDDDASAANASADLRPVMEVRAVVETEVTHAGFTFGEHVERQPDDGSITILDRRPVWITDTVLGGFYVVSSMPNSHINDFSLYTNDKQYVCTLRLININQVEKRFDLGYSLNRVVMLRDAETNNPMISAVRDRLNLKRFGLAVQALIGSRTERLNIYFDRKNGGAV